MKMSFLLNWALEGLVDGIFFLCFCTTWLSDRVLRHHPCSKKSVSSLFVYRKGPKLLDVIKRCTVRYPDMSGIFMTHNITCFVWVNYVRSGTKISEWQSCFACYHSIKHLSGLWYKTSNIQCLLLPALSKTRSCSSHWQFRYTQELKPNFCLQMWHRAGACW